MWRWVNTIFSVCEARTRIRVGRFTGMVGNVGSIPYFPCVELALECGLDLESCFFSTVSCFTRLLFFLFGCCVLSRLSLSPGHYNHCLFWNTLCNPASSGAPSGKVCASIVYQYFYMPAFSRNSVWCVVAWYIELAQRIWCVAFCTWFAA